MQDHPSVLRVGIRDHKFERVADVKNIRQTGHFGNNSALLLSDTGTQDVYALDWNNQYLLAPERGSTRSGRQLL